MKKLGDEDLAKLRRFAAENSGISPDLLGIIELANVMAETLARTLGDDKADLCIELSQVASSIQQTKDDLAEFRLSGIASDRIPAAGRELDAVVEATEAATHSIMNAAEEIMCADPSSDDFNDVVMEKVTTIFEACSFQDITGQRIANVVETLDYIDRKVNRQLLKLAGSCNEDAVDKEQDLDEMVQRKRDLILNGPQLEGKGVDQDFVDSLFD